MKGVNRVRRHLIEDAIACERLTLDVQRLATCANTISKEFAPSIYHFEEAPMALAFKTMFEKWLSETAMPEAIAA